MARTWARTVLGVVLIAFAATACSNEPQSAPTNNPASASPAVPAQPVDEPTPARVETQTLTVAGGCFWGVQGLFQHVDGVTAAESGYVGGTRATANYEAVNTGGTAHTEAVRITFDPARVSEDELLQVLFTVIEDPVHLTRLGTDGHATQYRSAIYAQNEAQRNVAESVIARMDKAGTFPGPIVTAVLPTTEFFPAERYHQDFMYLNPTEPYIASSEMPKLAALKRTFPEQYREKPVLMFPEDA